MYLNNLRSNNNKIWFQETRADYEKYLLGNFEELVKSIGPYMLEIDPYIDINFKKCISRIYRDVRFSKDKSPYRPNMWISFKRAYKDWKLEPTYYFEIFPEGYRFGMGYYDMPKEYMEKLRKLIEDDDEEFNQMYAKFKKQKLFTLEGNSYKRVINQNISEELREWYQKKEIYFVCNRSLDSTIFSKELVSELIKAFKILSPMYEFFLKLKGNGEIED